MSLPSPATAARAPWRDASPERPVLFRPAEGSTETPPVPGLALEAVLGDPFSWKLLPGSEGLNRRLDEAEKAAALEREARGASGVPYGCFVSTPAECALAARSGVAFLYIPGEVCRQADVLEAAGATGVPLVLERGPFLPPSDVVRALDKIGGAACLLVDAGTVNGYSDRVLDPRALWLLRATGRPFGVHLGELVSPANALYGHKPAWLSDEAFLEPLALAARALGAIAYVLPGGTRAAASVRACVASPSTGLTPAGRAP